MKFTLRTSDNFAQIAAQLVQAPGRIQVNQAETAFRAGTAMVNIAQSKFRSAPATTMTATRVRSGILRNSLQSRVTTNARAGSVQVSGPVTTVEVGYLRGGEDAKVLEYAATQEFGATIKPRHGRMLAIPIGEETNKAFGDFRMKSAMTAAGVLRMAPKDYPKDVLFRIGRFLFQKIGPNEIMPMFFLTPQVTIPPRPALRPSADEVMPRWIEWMQAAAAQAITGET